MKRMKLMTALMLAISLVAPANGQDVATPDLSQNAALRYWMAFLSLSIQDDEWNEAVADWDEIEIDQARALLGPDIDANGTLAVFHWAAELDACVWSIDRAAGPYALMPHLGPARSLARLAMLRVRVRLHDGDTSGAVDDLLAVMKLGRAFENDRVLISSLVGISIESMAVGFVAEQFSAFDDDAVHRLSQGLADLPPRVSLGVLIDGERTMFLGWWADKIRQAQQDGADAEDLRETAAALGIEDFGGPGEPIGLEQWLAWVEEADEAYAEARRVSDLPYAEYRASIGELEAGFRETGNQLIVVFMPSVTAVRSSHDRARARLAMFEALLAIKRFPMFLEGEAEVLQDPFGEGRFEFIFSEGEGRTVIGLRSQLIDREGNKVELRADTGVPAWSLRDTPIFEEDR